jgi:hypothetical protein
MMWKYRLYVQQQQKSLTGKWISFAKFLSASLKLCRTNDGWSDYHFFLLALQANVLLFKKKIFLGQCLYFSFRTHKTCILSRLYTTELLWLPKKPYALAGFEPGSFVPEADVMSAGPRHQGTYVHMYFCFFIRVDLIKHRRFFRENSFWFVIFTEYVCTTLPVWPDSFGKIAHKYIL